MGFTGKVKKIKDNNDGFTLIELIVSIVLLTIIIVTFLSVFVYVTNNNITSGQIVDEGYVAQTYMEGIIDRINQGGDWDEKIDNIKTDYTTYVAPNPASSEIKHTFKKKEERYYIKTEITEGTYTLPGETTENDNLIKVVVDVYRDSSYSEKAASVQNIITK